MYKLKVLSYIVLLGFIFSSCQKDNDLQLDQDLENLLVKIAQENGGSDMSHFILPDSDALSSIPQDPKNPLTKEKIELGKLLYHEAALGVKPKEAQGLQSYSCASCHFAKAGFQAGTAQGIGEGGVGFGLGGEQRKVSQSYTVTNVDVQPLRTPTTLNTAFQELMLWNGQFGATGDNVGTESQWTADTPKEVNHLGYHGLETQAIAGMGVHRMDCDLDLMASFGYNSLFDEAFPNVPFPQRYDLERAGLAIAAFERTIFANEAPFQQWLKGDVFALTESEKRGAILFFGEAECASCHNNPALSSMEFHALGMDDLQTHNPLVINVNADDQAHLGRGGFTKNAADNYKFKVPQLYNIKDSPFYGHGASFKTIKQVVRYKNAGVIQNPNVPETQVADAFKALYLSESEISDLTAFIERGLYDPALNRYEPDQVLSGACIPNNDELSREDLDCD